MLATTYGTWTIKRKRICAIELPPEISLKGRHLRARRGRGRIRHMSSDDYVKFQQCVFDELAELEYADQQRILVGMVLAGERYGIDVITEIVDKHRPLSDVIVELRRKQPHK